MKKYDIEHIPVMDGDEAVGSISEAGLFLKVFSNPDIRNAKVAEVMESPYPVVDFNSPVERLSTLIHRENGAVLSRDEAGNLQVVTKYDIIQALAK
jgi:cystathionine beta-synthase